jgi:uncharacterized protein
MTLMRIVALLLLTTVSLFAAEGDQLDKYVFGMLKKGPNWGTGSKEEGAKMQQEHLANIRRMHDEGKLIVAGPLLDNGEIRGLFIFRDAPLDELKALIDRDPAVKSGRLIIESHPWMAAKGIKTDLDKK